MDRRTLTSIVGLSVFVLSLTGTTWSPTPSLPPTFDAGVPVATGAGGADASVAVSPIDRDGSAPGLPPPWDQLGLPSAARTIDAIRFVHAGGDRTQVQAEYVASLGASGWTLRASPAPKTPAADKPLEFRRGNERLVLRVTQQPGAVLVSMNLD